MSKSKNVPKEQPTQEQNANVEKLNVEQAAPVVPKEPTLDELKAAKSSAIENALMIDADDKKTDIEKSKAWAAVKSAGDAITLFGVKQQKAELERQMNEKIELAKTDIMATFGISAQQLDDAIKSETLRASFLTVFGKPAIVAKEGQTGKSLVAEHGTRGGKSAEIVADLEAGMTHADLLAKYPTADNPNKLNGTARTVISAGGWKKQSDGTYQKG